MKSLSRILFMLSLLWGVTACGEDDLVLPNGYVETTDPNATTFVLKGYNVYTSGFSVCQPEGFDSPFYIGGVETKYFKGSAYKFAELGICKSLAETTDKPSSWVELAEIRLSAGYWARLTTATEYKYIRFRILSIEGNNVIIEYLPAGNEERPNSNANGAVVAYATNLEMPKFNASNVFAAHTVEYNKEEILNYALEWNDAARHSAWVAFSFDENTSKNVVGRTNAWAWDPKMPATVNPIEEANHKSDGFDKGHICASGDRVYDKTANEQTFYYTNISPMLNDLNTGLWGKLESLLRDKVSSYDKVYVVKGGTADNRLKGFTGTPVYNPPQTPKTDADGFTIKGLGVPLYYFMAILYQKGDSFSAIGYWVEHKEGHPKNPSAQEISTYAVTIDQLEENTNLDFFCNLPDDIETTVEASFAN